MNSISVATNIVQSHNDWDPLEEVIVGSIKGGWNPRLDKSFYLFRWPLSTPDAHTVGPISKKIVEETEEDIDSFIKLLEKFDVKVRRPDEIDYGSILRTPFWETEGENALMPRDSILVLGNKIIETPMMCRSRQQETLAYKNLLLEYFQNGCEWIAAPKPRLTDDAYTIRPPDEEPTLNNNEPIFDAANVLRIGEDLFFNINNSGNQMGLKWLQSLVGDTYRIHPVSVSSDHIDTTLVPLGPGQILVKPRKAMHEDLPEQFASWDIIVGPETPPELDFGLGYPWCTNWIGMNVFNIDADNVVVEAGQSELIRILESKTKKNVIPLQYRHSRTFGGGWHCITADVRRKGELLNYF